MLRPHFDDTFLVNVDTLVIFDRLSSKFEVATPCKSLTKSLRSIFVSIPWLIMNHPCWVPFPPWYLTSNMCTLHLLKLLEAWESVNLNPQTLHCLIIRWRLLRFNYQIPNIAGWSFPFESKGCLPLIPLLSFVLRCFWFAETRMQALRIREKGSSMVIKFARMAFSFWILSARTGRSGGLKSWSAFIVQR